jgi:hypothetical protein
MSNGFAQQSNDNKAATKWLQHVQRQEASCHAQTVADSLHPMNTSLSLSLCPPAEPPSIETTLPSVMTGNILHPDQDSVSVSSNNTFNSIDSKDSLFSILPLARRGSFSYLDEDDDKSFGHVPTPLQCRGSFSSSDDDGDDSSNCTDHLDVETVTSESSFDTAYEDGKSISTTHH